MYLVSERFKKEIQNSVRRYKINDIFKLFICILLCLITGDIRGCIFGPVLESQTIDIASVPVCNLL